jgi:hypothetical protein
MVSAGTIWARSRALVKTANKELFVPKGLKCKVLKTKKGWLLLDMARRH